MNFIGKTIRSIFFLLDSTLYKFIPNIYNLIITISRTTVLTQGQIKEFADRIQAIITIFMLFKVSFSLITYIINPDEFSDKSKGFGKLWVNIIISLVLLVTTPYIFNMAFELQNIVLKDNSLSNLIFGKEIETSFTQNAGQDLAFSTMIPFFRPNTAIQGLEDCNTIYDSDGITFNAECKKAIEGLLKNNINDNPDDIVIGNYSMGIEKRNVGLAFRIDAVNCTDSSNLISNFVFNYDFPFSTAAAVIVLLVLISFCMDVALRSVKLAFLQLISPIPIISFIDPKQGKDGLFKKWYSMCFSTYLSLFIRLLGLYFGVYLIGIVLRTGFTDTITGETQRDFLVQLLMVIGILMFVKQLPKILEGFGLKLDGGGKFQLNPFKKFEEEAFGGKQILGTGAALGAAALAGGVNAASRLPAFGRKVFNKDNWTKDGKLSFGSVLRGAGRTVGALGTVAGSSIAGFSSAAFRGTGKMLKGEKAGKIFANSYGEAMFAKIQREDLNRKGSTWLGRRSSDIHRLTGTLDAAQRQVLDYGEIENQYKANQESLKSKQEALTRQKESEKRLLIDKSKALTRINDLISSEKSVKDIDDQIKSLTDSGGYYAHAGELNANGRDAQAKMATASGKLRDEENSIKVKIDENEKMIAEMKSNGTYYSPITGGVSSEASRIEKQIKTDRDELVKKTKHNDEVIAQWQVAINNNENLHYQAGDLTEEGQLLKDKLTSARDEAYVRLKSDSNSEVSTQVEILTKLGLNSSYYETESGGFDKASMYDAQKAVAAVDAKYQVSESQLAEELRQLTDQYETNLKLNGLDKNSVQWKANEADHAADKVTAPQPGNFMPSPDSRGSNFTYDSRFISGFSGNRGNNYSGNNPPPSPPHGN